MAQLWEDLDNYRKFSTLIMLLSMLFMLLMFVREYLKMTDKDYKYSHPSFLSVMTIFCFLSVDGIFSLTLLNFGQSVWVSEILGAVIAIVLTPICFIASKKISELVRAYEVVEPEKLVNCTGMAVSKLGNTSGKICVAYKNKFIDTDAVSKQEISDGEEIVVVGFSEGNLICERKTKK